MDEYERVDLNGEYWYLKWLKIHNIPFCDAVTHTSAACPNPGCLNHREEKCHNSGQTENIEVTPQKGRILI